MNNPLPYIINDQTFWVSPERCLYWEEQRTLIVSDLHLGKSGHFRKEGIAVPQSVYKADLQRLIAQLYDFKAEKLLIVGDMTHSRSNKELELFLKWRNDFPGLPFELVRGNHDILEDQWYRDAGITLHEKQLQIGSFLFRHEKDPEHVNDVTENGPYIFSGHVHPGIRLRVRANNHFVSLVSISERCMRSCRLSAGSPELTWWNLKKEKWFTRWLKMS